MMGGGFGGCTINVVKRENIEPFSDKISTAYQSKFKKKPEVYITQIEDGARRVPSNQ
jgi:galactokinase